MDQTIVSNNRLLKESHVFVGSSLNTLVFMYVYGYSARQITNMYSIGIEIIQGIASTMGVILTVPFVSVICAWHLKTECSGRRTVPEKGGQDVGLQADGSCR